MPRVFTPVLIVLTVATAAHAALPDIDAYYLRRFGVTLPPSGGHAGKLRAQAEAVPEKCLTPLHRQLRKDWSSLQPGTQALLAKYVAPSLPYPATPYPTPQGHFVIHYSTYGDNAVRAGDANDNGVPDYVEKVGAVLEEVYEKEVAEMGYPSPPPINTGGKYEIYLIKMATGEYGYTDAGLTAPPSGVSSTSVIALDSAYPASVFDTYSATRGLQVTAAHEFHHAIQYGIHYWFDPWYGEATSSWIEDEVYDNVNQLYEYLNPMFYRPTLALSHWNPPSSTNPDGDYYGGYSRWIFNRFLAERYTRDIIKSVWMNIGTGSRLRSIDDVVPAIPEINKSLRQQGTTLSVVYQNLARRLVFGNWSSHLDDAPLIPQTAATAVISTYSGNSPLTAPAPNLESYSYAVYEYMKTAEAPATLELQLPSLASDVHVVAFQRDGTGVWREYAPVAGVIKIPDFSGGNGSALLLYTNTGDATSAPAPASGKSSGGGCFIATAAYGTPLHPKVDLLRKFRDSKLMTNAPGRLFVRCYYRLSPPVAAFISRHETARAIVRGCLTPLMWIAERSFSSSLPHHAVPTT